MALYGYGRVSTSDQTTDNQKHEIEKAGFKLDGWFADEGVSGAKMAMERPAFRKMIEGLLPGDSFVITKLDRLGRNAVDTQKTVKELMAKGINVRIMQFGGMDIQSPAGKLFLTMIAAFAEMERDFLVERTKAGLERTKAQGTKLGAPLTITPEVLRQLIDKKAEGYTLDMLASQYGIPRNTIARNIARWKDSYETYVLEWSSRKAQYASKVSA